MIKRILCWTILFNCFFLIQTINAQTEEMLTPTVEQTQLSTDEEPILSVEEPTIIYSVEELYNALLAAEKKLESIKKELRYTETLKGSKKYKKEVALKFKEANNNLKLAKAAFEAASNSVDSEVIEEVEEVEEVEEQASTETFP